MNLLEEEIETIEKEDDMKEFVQNFFKGIPGVQDATPVPVIQASSLTEQDFINNWVSINRPCLIKGAIAHWPAVEKWKEKNYWLQSCKNIKVDTFPHGNYIQRDRNLEGRKIIDFHEAIEKLFEGDDYIYNISPKEITPDNGFSGVIKDLPGFPFLSNPKLPIVYEHRRFFLYRRSSTAWHYHHIDETLMCQVNGTKRVVLLPPHIPKPDYVINFLDRELHLEGIEFDQSLNLEPVVADVEEGDALYIPPYWHHGVAPATSDIGSTLAFCWRSPMHIMGDLSNYFVRRLLKNGFWPLNRYSIYVPIVGIFAVGCHLLRKISSLTVDRNND